MTRGVGIRAKFLLATAAALLPLFAVTAYVIERSAVQTASRSLEAEARASLRAYESLWRARTDLLASVSLALSGMSDVRAAFGTGDEATMRDTAGERWAVLARENAIFAVTDPRGRVIASLGERPLTAARVEAVVSAGARFPHQSFGFLLLNGALYQVVITPVYVDAAGGHALISVLVAGYLVDERLAARLKESTGGSEFVFAGPDSAWASTLGAEPASRLLNELRRTPAASLRVTTGGKEYLALRQALLDVDGHANGSLWILRSFDSSRQAIETLRRNLLGVWACALLAALIVAWIAAQRLLRPIAALDEAASEVSRHNFAHRVRVGTTDELGRLGGAFNEMSASIERAEQELIRQERMATIARLSSSLVHDLRNPLASIYAGAEILLEPDYPPEAQRRIATNIHRAARQVKNMLDELADVQRRRREPARALALHEIVSNAWAMVEERAVVCEVVLNGALDEELTVHAEPNRLERVFANLFANAIDAMADGGEVRIAAHREGDAVLVSVADTGPGIDASVRERLFEPFASSKSSGGMGLGLALSRQAVREAGGDLWADDQDATAGERGARFWLRLPCLPASS